MGFFSIFGAIWESFVGRLFKKAAQTTIGLVAEGLADIAAEIVKHIADNDFMSGPEKRDAAFKAIVNCAEREGKEFSDHAVNIAIELALALFKEGAAELTKAE